MAARTVEQQWNLLSSAVDTAERAKKALHRTVTSTHMATAYRGNDAAFKRATWAQNGGAKNERDINSIMAYLREHG